MEIEKIRGVIGKILSFQKNNATEIYSRLDEKLKFFKDLKEFYIANNKLRSEVDNFKRLCTSDNRKENLNIIGLALEDKLNGRFVKEKSRVSEPLDEHIQNWLQRNKNLNIETDEILVQAGFLCIFEV